MAGSYLLYAGDGALKSVSLDGLPPEAWQVVRGGVNAPGDVIALYKSAAWLYRAVEQRAAALLRCPSPG